MFGRLFGRRKNALQEKADGLVPAINAAAISAFVPLLDAFPSLKKAKPEDADFFLTVAAVFIAVTRLNRLRLENAQQELLLDRVQAHFTKWEPANAVGAFQDCKTFFDRTCDALEASAHGQSEFLHADAIGMWVFWNLFGQQPRSDDDRRVARALGTMAIHWSSNWWD